MPDQTPEATPHADLRAALTAIRDMEAEEVPSLPAHDNCEECARRSKAAWPPSGMCEERYRQFSNRDRQRKDNENAQQWRMRGIARAALADTAPAPLDVERAAPRVERNELILALTNKLANHDRAAIRSWLTALRAALVRAALAAPPAGLETGPWPDCLACRERHVREGHARLASKEGASVDRPTG